MWREKKKNCETSVEYIIQKPMETYCVICKKYTANENLSVIKTKQNRLVLSSNCAIFGKKQSTSLRIKNSTILIIF